MKLPCQLLTMFVGMFTVVWLGADSGSVAAPSGETHRPRAQTAWGKRLGLIWAVGRSQLIVGAVAPSTPAATANFRAGDVITSVEQNRVTHVSAFDAAMAPFAGGQTLKILVQRDSHPVRLWLRIPEDRGERPFGSGLMTEGDVREVAQARMAEAFPRCKQILGIEFRPPDDRHPDGYFYVTFADERGTPNGGLFVDPHGIDQHR